MLLPIDYRLHYVTIRNSFHYFNGIVIMFLKIVRHISTVVGVLLYLTLYITRNL